MSALSIAMIWLALQAAAPLQGTPSLSETDRTALAQMLGRADQEGLDPRRFTAGSTDEDLRATAVRFAAAEHGLVQQPFPKNWAVRPAPYDAAKDFDAALREGRIVTWTRSLAPSAPGYANLLAALARYREMAEHGGWTMVGPGPRLKPGDRGDRVRRLRERLAAEGLKADPPADTAQFDEGLSQMLRTYQALHGLDETGVLDPRTQASVDVALDRRIDQIRANLERWRWLPRPMPSRRIEVNVAGARLIYYANDGEPLVMRTVVGKPSTPTPMLQDRIEALIINPPWNVPAKIAAREILPKAARDPSYLSREGFVVRAGRGGPAVQQKPSARCALGHVKFDLPNPFDVYLHDTPTRSAFDRPDRDLSHGCVRVQKADDLARSVLANENAWSTAQVEAAMAETETRRIPLVRPLPVFLLYWTAWAKSDRTAAFRDDIYRWDPIVLRLIQADPAAP